MFRYYPALLLLASSYRFYTILRTYTNLVLSNQAVPELVYFVVPRFFNFLILLSFVSIIIFSKAIREQISKNTINLEISKTLSFRKYFISLSLQNFYTQIRVFIAPLILPVFIFFFVPIEKMVLISAYIGFIGILFIEAIVFSFFSVFRLNKLIVLVLFLLLYGLFFATWIQDYFYGLLNIRLLILYLIFFANSIYFSKFLIKWSLNEN